MFIFPLDGFFGVGCNESSINNCVGRYILNWENIHEKKREHPTPRTPVLGRLNHASKLAAGHRAGAGATGYVCGFPVPRAFNLNRIELSGLSSNTLFLKAMSSGVLMLQSNLLKFHRMWLRRFHWTLAFFFFESADFHACEVIFLLQKRLYAIVREVIKALMRGFLLFYNIKRLDLAVISSR